MAFKLTKAEGKQRAELVAALELASTEVATAIEAANEAIEAAVIAVNAKIAAYNETLANAFTYTEELVERLDDEFSGRSETWQDGDKGSAARDFMGAWSELDLEPVDDIEVEPIDEFDPAHRDDFENAPETVED